MGEDIHINHLAFLDLIASTAAATFGVRYIVETIFRINKAQAVVYEKAFDVGTRAFLEVQFGDIVNKREDRVAHGNAFQPYFGKQDFKLSAKCLVPVRIGTTRAGQYEAAESDVFFKVFTVRFT